MFLPPFALRNAHRQLHTAHAQLRAHQHHVQDLQDQLDDLWPWQYRRRRQLKRQLADALMLRQHATRRVHHAAQRAARVREDLDRQANELHTERYRLAEQRRHQPPG